MEIAEIEVCGVRFKVPITAERCWALHTTGAMEDATLGWMQAPCL